MANNARTRLSATVAALAAFATCAPAVASVRDGVEAWSRGDYAAAVAEWEGPATAGDPDAMFNMGQAYRLGRGVPMNLVRARDYYRAAAETGHVQAADTYGLMLFQDGQREAALPYVQAAADRGDPRARYLLGIAHFNGDVVERDWERAYALLSLASGAGLPQAGPAIAQMDEHIPLDQRQNAAALARQMELEAEQARAVQLTAADLVADSAMPGPSPAVQPREAARSIGAVAASPSVAAARDALAQARQATGTEDPATAGATYARAEAEPPTPPALQDNATPPQAARPASRANGPWRVQLGAFGVAGNAERLWNRVSDRPEVAGTQRLFISSGRVTVVQAGGYASQAEAQTACSSLKKAGFDCLVTRN